jgi:Tat protein secretion system quality control protein TatD with DNase activity
MNIPEYVLHTAQKIADLRGLSLEKLATATTHNAMNIFKMTAH